MTKQTRGERNNNPGNIRKGPSVWQGMAEAQPDLSFITFKSATMGIRALAKTLLTYYHKHELDTVEKIINRWAPTNENDTQSYVNSVCGELRASPTDLINLDAPATMEILVRAIIRHENGRVSYTDAVIQTAVESALGVA